MVKKGFLLTLKCTNIKIQPFLTFDYRMADIARGSVGGFKGPPAWDRPPLAIG
jgi:hypothetical protein